MRSRVVGPLAKARRHARASSTTLAFSLVLGKVQVGPMLRFVSAGCFDVPCYRVDSFLFAFCLLCFVIVASTGVCFPSTVIRALSLFEGCLINKLCCGCAPLQTSAAPHLRAPRSALVPRATPLAPSPCCFAELEECACVCLRVHERRKEAFVLSRAPSLWARSKHTRGIAHTKKDEQQPTPLQLCAPSQLHSLVSPRHSTSAKLRRNGQRVSYAAGLVEAQKETDGAVPCSSGRRAQRFLFLSFARGKTKMSGLCFRAPCPSTFVCCLALARGAGLRCRSPAFAGPEVDTLLEPVSKRQLRPAR